MSSDRCGMGNAAAAGRGDSTPDLSLETSVVSCRSLEQAFAYGQAGIAGKPQTLGDRQEGPHRLV